MSGANAVIKTVIATSRQSKGIGMFRILRQYVDNVWRREW